MCPTFRIRPQTAALAFVLVFAAGAAHAQCLITGPNRLCDGPVQLCGPDGPYEYVWTDPAGGMSFERCLTAALPGIYTLLLGDITGATFGPCSLRVEGPDPPPCSISGPVSACLGGTVELCGPAGDPAGGFTYAWSGPNGFSAAAACIQVSESGTYTLAVGRTTDRCPPSVCEHSVIFETCRRIENCPRPASFWMRQCLTDEPEELSVSAPLLAELAARVDARAAIFDWSDARAGFCAALQPRPSTLRARAKRQFAAVHANVCAGEMGLPPAGGRAIALDPAALVDSDDAPTTVGAWLAAADARLQQLEPLDRRTDEVKRAYRRIIREGWRINHGRGIGPVCGREDDDRGEDRDAAHLVADREYDPEEPLAVETADDEDDRPERARATPNPFSTSTSVVYVVSGTAAQEVSIAVYDLAGRVVRELARGPQSPGTHEARWDGRGADGARVRSGVYFVRGAVGDRRIAGALTVLR